MYKILEYKDSDCIQKSDKFFADISEQESYDGIHFLGNNLATGLISVFCRPLLSKTLRMKNTNYFSSSLIVL